MSNLVWKVESAWDEYNNCRGQILYFHKKENAEKLLRKWLKVEIEIWKRAGFSSYWIHSCETWEEALEYLMSQGGHPEVGWIDTIRFEDEGEDKNED